MHATRYDAAESLREVLSVPMRIAVLTGPKAIEPCTIWEALIGLEREGHERNRVLAQFTVLALRHRETRVAFNTLQLIRESLTGVKLPDDRYVPVGSLPALTVLPEDWTVRAVSDTKAIATMNPVTFNYTGRVQASEVSGWAASNEMLTMIDPRPPHVTATSTSWAVTFTPSITVHLS